MVKYQGELKSYTFRAMRKHYPCLQKRVYETLLEMTPAQLQFEFAAIPDKEDYKFCFEGIDPDTYKIIGTVMASMLDEKNLILTRDDLTLIYLRFRELMFLYEALRQGILVAQLTDTDTEYYFDIEESVKSIDKQPVKYRKYLRYYR